MRRYAIAYRRMLSRLLHCVNLSVVIRTTMSSISTIRQPKVLHNKSYRRLRQASAGCTARLQFWSVTRVSRICYPECFRDESVLTLIYYKSTISLLCAYFSYSKRGDCRGIDTVQRRPPRGCGLLLSTTIATFHLSLCDPSPIYTHTLYVPSRPS